MIKGMDALRFMEVLDCIMRSDNCYLLPVSENDKKIPCKVLIGYYDDEYVYFIPSIITAMSDIMMHQTDEDKLNMHKVMRQLSEAGMIKSGKEKADVNRYRPMKKIGDKSSRYITFDKVQFLYYLAKIEFGI